MNKNNFYARSIIVIAGLMCVFMAGCGGGAVIPQSVAGPSAVGGVQEEPNNNLFIVPPGHPNKIVFQSEAEGDINKGTSNKIFAMNRDGSNVSVIAEMPSFSGRSAPSRKWEYITPAVTSDGLKVFYSADYYATATSILYSSITGGGQNLSKRYGEIFLEDPAVSWDGGKLAFVGYTANIVTVAVPEDEIAVDMPSPTKNPTEFTAAAQFSFFPSGYRLTTNSYVDNGTKGIMELQQNNPTTCPAPGEPYLSYENKNIYATYTQLFLVAGSGKIKYTQLEGKFFCINLDDANFILVEITDFLYPITKDLKLSCSSSSDCPGGVACGNEGRCVDTSGNITYDPCSTGDDCDSGNCNKEMLCALNDESVLASLTFNWTWLQTGYTDTTTITEKFDKESNEADEYRWGAGMNFIGQYTNKRMDLYTMNVDGTNLVRHTDDLDADRFPCFSPASSNFVYFTKAVLDEGSQNVEKPVSSAIMKLNISTGEFETVLSPSYLVKECAFSPSGSSMLYSAFNGTNYDIHMYNTTSKTASFFIDTGGNDLSPTYSPDGKYVAFQSDYTGDYDIYVTDYKRTSTINLTANRSKTINDTNPSWTP